MQHSAQVVEAVGEVGVSVRIFRRGIELLTNLQRLPRFLSGCRGPALLVQLRAFAVELHRFGGQLLLLGREFRRLRFLGANAADRHGDEANEYQMKWQSIHDFLRRRASSRKADVNSPKPRRPYGSTLARISSPPSPRNAEQKARLG